MQRRHLLCCAFTLPLGRFALAEEPSKLLDLFTRMAAALSAGSPAEFLAPFDRSMPDYRKLRTEIFALLDQAEVASSVELVQEQGNEQRRWVELDWILEIRSLLPVGPWERRRQILKASLARRGKSWKVISLDPLSFFAPPRL